MSRRAYLSLGLLAFLIVAACTTTARLGIGPTPTPTYQPPAEIVRLAQAARMTGKARSIFYSTRPEITDNRSAFEAQCQAPSPTDSIELGCYTSEGGIYVLLLPTPLDKEAAVTAAHEMLHAAYQQLSRADRATLNADLEEQAAQLGDGALGKTLRQYRTLEPGQRDNELHSILGSEYAPLSTRLEKYYSQYFTDRMSIVAAARQFRDAFQQLQDRLDSLETQIGDLRGQMDAFKKAKDTSAYNALVSRFNSLVEQYNQTVDEYNQLSRTLMGREAPASGE